MGMQWNMNNEPVGGYVYRSQLNQEEYNQMTPDEKKNVLYDTPFNRNYRVM